MRFATYGASVTERSLCDHDAITHQSRIKNKLLNFGARVCTQSRQGGLGRRLTLSFLLLWTFLLSLRSGEESYYADTSTWTDSPADFVRSREDPRQIGAKSPRQMKRHILHGPHIKGLKKRKGEWVTGAGGTNNNDRMHPRNVYKGNQPDFGKLAEKYRFFAEHVQRRNFRGMSRIWCTWD
eukprot:1333714-Amorphochlora_amoeboformis.AAC.1